jgi:hypothetical protein
MCKSDEYWEVVLMLTYSIHVLIREAQKAYE